MSRVRKDQSRSRAPLSSRRGVLAALAAGSATGVLAGCGNAADEQSAESRTHNSLLWAVAWKQTAAEYAALCHQAYNLARYRLDAALASREDGDAPLAVISDMDDTMMHAASYWGYLVDRDMEFFDDAIWDEWLPENQVTPVPGARDFFLYCEANDVEVFYVTNRDQGDRTFEYALGQLQFLEMPYADEAHLYVFRDTSDKTPAREEIAARYQVPIMLGDNLNDFKRDYYVNGVDERMALMQRDSAEWGDKYILLPNPTDGHWVRAIFGDSEPAPTEANRQRLKEAATRVAWEGPA